MKITVLSDNLQKKLPLLNHAISSRNQLPILGNILFEAKENKATLCATDLEIGYEITIPATVEEEGAVAIPAKIFSDLILSLPQEKISLSTTDTTIEVQSKKSKSVLQTMPKDEFPSIYEQKGEELIGFSAKTLQENLSPVAFAASLETTRPALSGVLIKTTQEGFLFVATDGYRLSLKKVMQKVKAVDKQILIPARVIREVLAFKEDSDIAIFLSSGNNQVLFSQDDTVLVGRLIDAEFPSYEKIIPTEASVKITFDREELLRAVKLCSVFARETANIIKLSLRKDKIVVSAKTPSLGENTADVEAKLVGEENEIAFNARYLLDILNAVSAEEMEFEMTGPLNAGVFKIANDSSFLHLIMPIRVQG